MKVARVPSQISRLRLIVTGPFAAFARCYTRALCPGADPNTRADYCRIDLGTGDDYFSMSPPPRVAVLVVQTRHTILLLFRSDFSKKNRKKIPFSIQSIQRELDSDVYNTAGSRRDCPHVAERRTVVAGGIFIICMFNTRYILYIISINHTYKHIKTRKHTHTYTYRNNTQIDNTEKRRDIQMQVFLADRCLGLRRFLIV